MAEQLPPPIALKPRAASSLKGILTLAVPFALAVLLLAALSAHAQSMAAAEPASQDATGAGALAPDHGESSSVAELAMPRGKGDAAIDGSAKEPGDALPDAPQPAMAGPAAYVEYPQPMPVPAHLTLRERFLVQAHVNFNLTAFIGPAFESAITMAHPPNNYPRDWSDGGGAFGRNYGAELARHTTSGMTHFVIAAMDHEDPRYYPSSSTNYAVRFLHALTATLVDRTESGGHALAFSNFAGAAAGGFVGMTYEPAGFDDTTHAMQRSAVELTAFGTANVLSEFSPDMYRLLRKAHMPNRFARSFLPDRSGGQGPYRK